MVFPKSSTVMKYQYAMFEPAGAKPNQRFCVFFASWFGWGKTRKTPLDFHNSILSALVKTIETWVPFPTRRDFWNIWKWHSQSLSVCISVLSVLSYLHSLHILGMFQHFSSFAWPLRLQLQHRALSKGHCWPLQSFKWLSAREMHNPNGCLAVESASYALWQLRSYARPLLSLGHPKLQNQSNIHKNRPIGLQEKFPVHRPRRQWGSGTAVLCPCNAMDTS